MVEWIISEKPVEYSEAIGFMEARVRAIREGKAPECIWLLQHPPLYTAGTSAKPHHLLDARFPVHSTGRGGEHTYHGPGQLIAYIMLDLKKRYAPHLPDVRDYVKRLERCIIATLRDYGVEGFIREGRVGVWVETGVRGQVSGVSVDGNKDTRRSTGDDLFRGGSGAGGDSRSDARPLMHNNESKIAALGVRITHGVSWHGISINVHPDLMHYSGIVPCGIQEYGVTSLAACGKIVSLQEVQNSFIKHFSGFSETCADQRNS